MAGKSNTIPTKRAGYNLKAIVSLCCLVFGIILAGPLYADYVVTDIHGKITKTASYWIEGKGFFLAESKEPIDVYEIKAVAAENLTPEQIWQHEVSMEACRKQVQALMQKEKGIRDATYGYMMQAPAPENGKRAVIDKKEKKRLKKGFEALENDLENLRGEWDRLVLPDFSLLLARDLKDLGLMSLESFIDQSMKYVASGDPTNGQYAMVSLKQADSFDVKFKAALPWK